MMMRSHPLTLSKEMVLLFDHFDLILPKMLNDVDHITSVFHKTVFPSNLLLFRTECYPIDNEWCLSHLFLSNVGKNIDRAWGRPQNPLIDSPRRYRLTYGDLTFMTYMYVRVSSSVIITNIFWK